MAGSSWKNEPHDRFYVDGKGQVLFIIHVSKRDVSAGAKAIKEYGLTFDCRTSL